MAEKNDENTGEGGDDAGQKPPLRPVAPPSSAQSSSAQPEWMTGLVPEQGQPSEPAEQDAAAPDWTAGLTEPIARVDPAEPEVPEDSGDFYEPVEARLDDAEPVTDASASKPLPGWVKPASIAGLVVLCVGVFGAIGVQAFGSSDEAPETGEVQALDAKLAQESAAPSAVADEFSCASGTSGDVETGNGAGDQRSVAGVVFAFHHAYYSDRDAKKIADLTVEDSPFRSAEAIKTLQEGIDTVPSDTDYCVSVTADGDKAEVEVTEARPSAAEETFVQEFTTKRDGDTVSIVDVVEE